MCNAWNSFQHQTTEFQFSYVPPLLGAHNAGQLFCIIIVWAGKASVTVSLHVVHQSTVGVRYRSRYWFRSLVQADVHGSVMGTFFSHQPPTVLNCPCIGTGVPSWDHDLLGARGDLTHSTGNVVVMQIIKRSICINVAYIMSYPMGIYITTLDAVCTRAKA